MKYALFFLMPLFCLSCNWSSQTATDNNDYSEEVVVTGKVLNREVYPQEKELTLIVPFFRDQETKYVAPIAEDGTFSFHFSSYAKCRNVVISKYIDQLYVTPGDSLYVEIDFKNLLDPKISGDAGKRNQEISIFAQSGYYYMKVYSIVRTLEPEAFETELQQEYKIRKERWQEFLDKYKPDEEVKEYTGRLLEIDYYQTLVDYAATQIMLGKDASRYKDLLSKIDPLFEDETIPSNIFDLAEHTRGFIGLQMYGKNRKVPTYDDFMNYPVGKNIRQYLCASSMSFSLMSNDTTLFSSRQGEFDSIVRIPALNKVVHLAYQDKQEYLKNPRKVSDYMLYGDYADQPELKEKMDFMTPVYQILDKYKGKVIYLDFWTTSCPPCLAEMEPLKELRKEFSTDDFTVISICAGGPRTNWENLLKRLDLRQPGIDCLYQDDISDEKSFVKILNQLQLKGYPHYLLLNREGIIVDYGTMIRPSFSETKQKIRKLI